MKDVWRECLIYLDGLPLIMPTLDKMCGSLTFIAVHVPDIYYLTFNWNLDFSLSRLPLCCNYKVFQVMYNILISKSYIKSNCI